MQSIKLTEEHKSKILEMCEVLFPEYNEIMFGKKYFPDTDYIWMYIKEGLPLEIHWFEFCITHLCTVIGNSSSYSNNFDESTLRGDMYFTLEWMKSNHPVDYLYSEFKKLKL